MEEKQEVSSKLQRAGILVITFVFVVSTIGIGVFYVLQAQNENKDAATQAAVQKALLEQQQQQTNTGQENKLEGTQLSGFTPTTTPFAKLNSTDTTVGTGTVVKETDTVTAHYTGAVASTGKIFQSSFDGGKPIAFPLSGVIAGWTQGVPGMKEGGTRRLFIPASLAYGANPPQGSGIPANADLVFDVTIVKIGE